MLLLCYYYIIISSQNKEISTKTKFFILDCLDISYKLLDSLSFQSQSQLNSDLYKKEDFLTCQFQLPPQIRKSSINSNFDLIRRSRFSSRADDLRQNKGNIMDLMNELVRNLGSDITFYQSFRLSDDEQKVISRKNKILISFFSNSLHKTNIKAEFLSLIEEITCEKFIIVGHILDIMYSMNYENATTIIEYLIYLFQEGVIDKEDIKHGIVLGLVNFKDNITNFPSSKAYLKKFLLKLTELDIIDSNLEKVYETCCDNIEKLIF